MGVLGKIFGSRRSKIINDEIANAYNYSPGKAYNTNIYFDAAEAFAKENNLKETYVAGSIGYDFPMSINGEKVNVMLAKSSSGTMTILARPAMG